MQKLKVHCHKYIILSLDSTPEMVLVCNPFGHIGPVKFNTDEIPVLPC